MEDKKVFDDAWRMKKNPFKEFGDQRKKSRWYLSLICIFDRKIGDDLKIVKESMANAINDYFDDSNPISSFNTQILINLVSSYRTDYGDLSPKIKDWESEEYYVYLITIDLN